jgi:hypothetical protein
MARQVYGRFDVGLDSKEGTDITMHATSITPSIGVTIGRHTRLYYLYLTTAPAALDAPSTMTLSTAPLADLLELALDEMAFDPYRARTEARLILVDTTERSHQTRRCREHRHLCEPADPVLVGLNRLQQRLWQRLGVRHSVRYESNIPGTEPFLYLPLPGVQQDIVLYVPRQARFAWPEELRLSPR